MSKRKFVADAFFRQRALAEAERYGSDAWVFVRELLQNARDAGARHVTFTTCSDGEIERVSCRDDGGGMSFEHARRYLFALYASSKDGCGADAGKFGIGFWSVLRFEPTVVTVRSRAGTGAAWEAVLDGRLEWATLGESELEVGTEVVLARAAPGRAAGSSDLGEQVFAAARRYGRFLTCRETAATGPPQAGRAATGPPQAGRAVKGRPGRALLVTVDGRRINAELALPAPSASFGGAGFRGAVGLGREPRVELFAHGLFVRSASCLQELAEETDERRETAAEGALGNLPSLAPQVLLDSVELDLLLARSDARQDRHLHRMLRAAERALDRLITRQLQALQPQPWFRLWWGALRERLEPALGKPAFVAAAVVVALVIAVAFGALAPQDSRPSARSPGVTASQPAAEIGALGGIEAGPAGDADRSGLWLDGRNGGGRPEDLRRGATDLREVDETRSRGYFDLSRSYRGPDPGSLNGVGSKVALSYRPANHTLLFNALVIEELRGLRWDAEPVPEDLPTYRGAPCGDDCLDVRLVVEEAPGPLRVPVPTGHRLEASSVRLDGLPIRVYENGAGEAILRAAGARTLSGVLDYRTGPARNPADRRRPGRAVTRSGPASGGLARVAASLRGLPQLEKVRQALVYVAAEVRYDRSPAVTAAYAQDPRGAFVETALAVGAGDCDVQNGLLVELLRLAGIEARLAVGFVGAGGDAAAGLHAWAEFLGTDGRWRAADASVLGTRNPDALARRMAAAGLGAGWPGWTGGRDPQGSTGVEIRKPPRRLFAPLLVLALALAVGGTVGMILRRRPTASLALDPAGDLAALLGGALRHPGAFAALPAMSHGRFIPLLGRPGGISLDRARRLSARQALFRSTGGSRLAAAAAKRGVAVIDGGTAEGRVVSLALGAIDLDRWSDLLDRSAEEALAIRINGLLEDLGEPWRVRTAPELGEPLLELALEDLGLGRRVVLIDPEHEVFAAAVRGAHDRPGTAAFSVLDLILQRTELDPRVRARLLATAARRALREVHP